MKVTLWLLLVFLAGVISACTDLPGAGPLPTDRPTPRPSITPTAPPTIVWFPPSRTPTPRPTPAQSPQPTPEPRPGLGAVLFQDDFSNTSGWQSGAFDGGTADFGNHSLSLVIPDRSATIISLRRAAMPDNYYLEMTVNANLCRGKDVYGLVFRSDGGLSAYRWLITCDGLTRVERWRPAEAAVIQDWTYIGEGGAPLSLRLGLWLYRDEMRYFVNDVYLFATKDPLLAGAQLGVMTRSTGQNPLSVSFSSLAVRAISSYVPTPIPSPTPNITRTYTRAPTWTPSH
jgi:hypothetical protein